MSSRSLVEITLPDGNQVAQVWCWSDISVVDWTVFFRPLAELIPSAEWRCVPIPDDVSDKEASVGH